MKVMLTLFFSVVLVYWGGTNMLKPSRVETDSFNYLLFTGMQLGWSDVRRKAAERRITPRQIRFWAAMAFLTGLIMLLGVLADIFT
jgi:hypothetical protein